MNSHITTMQRNGTNDTQYHTNSDTYEEEYDYENYVIMSRKWTRPPPPKRTTASWWRNSKYYEEDVKYDESLVVIDKDDLDNTTIQNNITSMPQSKEKTITKIFKRRKNPEQNRIIPNYDESLLLNEESSSIDEEFNDEPSSNINTKQKYMAPNVLECSKECIIDDIEKKSDFDKINDELYEKYRIELNECNPIYIQSQEKIPKPTKRRSRVTWHNNNEQSNMQEHESLSPSFKPQSNTIQRSVFFSKTSNGRIQLSLPSDKIHLVMDDTLEPGTLLLLHPIDAASHRVPLLVTSPSADIMDVFHSMEYVFTVDQDLYKRIVKEISDSRLIPCGFYYCCHEAGENKVNIWVAVVILLLVFTFVLAVTLIWPIE